MLNIRQVKHLAHAVDLPVASLERAMKDPSAFIDEFWLVDPATPDKQRRVIAVSGDIRRFQTKFYERVLLRKCAPSDYSYGGIRGRSIKLNASVHSQSEFACKADISAFYPSIHHSRVYRLFASKLGCSPDVARICTKLCTYRCHLALGLITSPFIADQLMHRVDSRIGAACRRMGLVYTRFVDDITISGPFRLDTCGINSILSDILRTEGFVSNAQKSTHADLGAGMVVTGIQVKRGTLNPTAEYLDTLKSDLLALRCLGEGGNFDRLYHTDNQIRGRINFVCWINGGRRTELQRMFNAVNWKRAAVEAENRGLTVHKRKLVRVSSSEL